MLIDTIRCIKGKASIFSIGVAAAAIITIQIST